MANKILCDHLNGTGQFLRVGSRCFALEQILSHRFGGDIEKLPKILSKNDSITVQAYFQTRAWDEAGLPHTPQSC